MEIKISEPIWKLAGQIVEILFVIGETARVRTVRGAEFDVDMGELELTGNFA